MLKFDHLTLPVADWKRSRDWYVQRLGMKLEFEVPDHQTLAVKDDHEFTIFFQQTSREPLNPGIALYFQVENVKASYASLSAAGVSFTHPPQPTFWGYGAEASDPDGYAIRLWDERTMKERA
jgi:predicted enzyme related to lactoylglutathione lyase